MRMGAYMVYAWAWSTLVWARAWNSKTQLLRLYGPFPENSGTLCTSAQTGQTAPISACRCGETGDHVWLVACTAASVRDTLTGLRCDGQCMQLRQAGSHAHREDDTREPASLVRHLLRCALALHAGRAPPAFAPLTNLVVGEHGTRGGAAQPVWVVVVVTATRSDDWSPDRPPEKGVIMQREEGTGLAMHLLCDQLGGAVSPRVVAHKLVAKVLQGSRWYQETSAALTSQQELEDALQLVTWGPATVKAGSFQFVYRFSAPNVLAVCLQDFAFLTEWQVYDGQKACWAKPVSPAAASMVAQVLHGLPAEHREGREEQGREV